MSEMHQDGGKIQTTKIRVLSTDVINKMAAGEVVERPYNAIKQLLENSIDAQATTIGVSIESGGLQTISVKDNGQGILVQDFPLLCRRHATSKIATLSDLASVRSYGFRGEALASLTYVADVTVVSRHIGSQVGYEAKFKDEIMLSEPKVFRGHCPVGTTITAENVFRSLHSRRKSQSGNSEAKLIKELLLELALTHPSMKFTLSSERGEQLHIDYSHLANKVESQEIIFSLMTGLNKSSFIVCPEAELFDSSHYSSSKQKQISQQQATQRLSQRNSPKIEAILTKLNTWQKWPECHISINGRIVESQPIKKIVERAYQQASQAIHHEKVSYCCFLSLKLNPELIDCNRHPSKKQVYFLKGEEILLEIMKLIEGKLQETGALKFINSQASQNLGLFDGFSKSIKMKVSQMSEDRLTQKQLACSPLHSKGAAKSLLEDNFQIRKEQDKDRNRTDSKQLPIQFFYKGLSQPSLSGHRQLIQVQNSQSKGQTSSQVRQNRANSLSAFYVDLRNPYQNTQINNQLTQLFLKMTYVGCFNCQYIFIQLQNKLYSLMIYPFIRVYVREYLRSKRPLHKMSLLKDPICVNQQLEKFIQQNVAPQTKSPQKQQLIYRRVLKRMIESESLLSQRYGISIRIQSKQKGVSQNVELSEYSTVLITSVPLIDPVFRTQTANKQEIIYFLIQIFARDFLSFTISPQQAEQSLFLDLVASTFMEKNSEDSHFNEREKGNYSTNNSETPKFGNQRSAFSNSYSSFFENELIPTLKSKGKFYELEFSDFSIQDYLEQMLDLRDAYKMFERC